MSAFGSITNLVGGTATLKQTPGQTYFWIQNNDTNPITLTFESATNTTLGQWILNPAAISGFAGDTLDSVQMPAFLDAASIVLTGVGAAQFSSGASSVRPFGTDCG